MPYLWTVKEYKGDFLWRTSDVAIWTTVEIGIGITAACMATLKPLLRHVMHMAGIATTEQGKSSRLRSNGGLGEINYISDQPLNELRLREDKGATTTTIKGMHRSSQAYKNGWAKSSRRSDSEEEIMAPSDRRRDRPDGWEGGISINRSVEVTATEETSEGGDFTKNVEESLGKAPWAYERV